MTESITDRMDKLSAQIDQCIDNSDKHLPFSEHFDAWWQRLNSECSRIYTEAGSESPSSINPKMAVTWLSEQIKKLHDFLNGFK